MPNIRPVGIKTDINEQLSQITQSKIKVNLVFVFISMKALLKLLS